MVGKAKAPERAPRALNDSIFFFCFIFLGTYSYNNIFILEENYKQNVQTIGRNSASQLMVKIITIFNTEFWSVNFFARFQRNCNVTLNRSCSNCTYVHYIYNIKHHQLYFIQSPKKFIYIENLYYKCYEKDFSNKQFSQRALEQSKNWINF